MKYMTIFKINVLIEVTKFLVIIIVMYKTFGISYSVSISILLQFL